MRATRLASLVEQTNNRATEQTNNRANEQTNKRVKLAFSFVRLCVCSFALSFALAEQPDFTESLVRIYLDREYLGLMIRDRIIPQTRVHEVAEFNGVVVNRQGQIVSYVGSYWSDLDAPDARVTIETADGERHPARLVGVDERIALAVLEAQQAMRRFPSLLFDDAIKSLSSGKRPLLVSFRESKWEVQTPALFDFQSPQPVPEREVHFSGLTSGAAKGGWEGGFVLSKEGKLLGILTRAERHPLSKKIEVYGMLPSTLIRDSLQRIVRDRKDIKSGWLGVWLEASYRPKVRDIVSGSPAQAAGLRAGDLIMQAQGRAIENGQELVQTIRWTGSGEKLNLAVERDGKVQTFAAVLTDRKDPRPAFSWTLEIPRLPGGGPPVSPQIQIYRATLPPPLDLGFELEALTAQLADFFRTPENCGLLVKSVLGGSIAQKAGFVAGDVLTDINGRKLSALTDLPDCLRSAKNGQLIIQFVRDRRIRKQTLVLP